MWSHHYRKGLRLYSLLKTLSESIHLKLSQRQTKSVSLSPFYREREKQKVRRDGRGKESEVKREGVERKGKGERWAEREGR